jgi:hypothetical protein
VSRSSVFDFLPLTVDERAALVARADDVASFHNAPPELVRGAFLSALLGEATLARPYGVLMPAFDGVALARAIRLRFRFLMEQTAATEGDFDRSRT